MKFRPYISLIVLAFSFASCQKVITVNTNKTNPQLVIDASITDQAGPYSVKLSQTTDYFTPGAYPAISGAIVTLTDNAGIQETLTETIPGTYKTSTMTGQPGKTYSLNISYAGKNYTAQSSMPTAVNIDSIGVVAQTGPGGGPPRPGRGNVSRLRIHGYFMDPPGISNYYALHFYRNDTLLDSNRFIIYSDKLVDGQQANIPFSGKLKKGDSVTMELQSIDKATYDFFKTSNDILDRGGQFTASAPSNPISNVSSGAVGYFAAYGKRKKTIFIDK